MSSWRDIAAVFGALTRGEIAATAVLAVMLAWLTINDLRSFRIPDAASVPLIIIGLLCSQWLAVTTPRDALAGALAGYAVFAGIGHVFFRLTAREGLGLGDAKLLAASGAWLGWYVLPPLVALAAISALVFSLVTRRRKVAFGPWLAVAFWILWVLRISA